MITRTLIAVLLLSGCAAQRTNPVVAADPSRHRAALAIVTVENRTGFELEVAFRTAAPPLQEVVIGRVGAGLVARMAPIPAGEPIILVARRNDGAEYQTQARSFALDAEFVWDIPSEATFLKAR